jgi:hypothetical protein
LSACAAESTGDLSGRPAGSLARDREALTAQIDAIVEAGRLKGELWRMNLAERWGGPVQAKSVAVDGDLLLVQDVQDRIHAIARSEGVHRWPLALPGPLTQSIGGTSSSLAFVATDDLVAVERRSGARLNGTKALPRPLEHLGFFPSGRAVAIGATAYVGKLAPFSLQSLDLAGGQDGWAYATSSPVVDVVAFGDGPTAQVIGATEDGLLFSLPPRGATESAWAPGENWYRRLSGTRIVTPLVLVGDSLVFGSHNGFLIHVDARTGAVRSKAGGGLDLRGHEAMVAGGVAYQRTGAGELKAFDLASGAELWTTPADRAVTRIGDRVYVQSGADVAVLDAKSGKRLAGFSAGGLALPTVQGGGMLLASDGTNLFALE